eukprot:4571326-Prymnesium_polylepis.2
MDAPYGCSNRHVLDSGHPLALPNLQLRVGNACIGFVAIEQFLQRIHVGLMPPVHVRLRRLGKGRQLQRRSHIGEQGGIVARIERHLRIAKEQASGQPEIGDPQAQPQHTGERVVRAAFAKSVHRR